MNSETIDFRQSVRQTGFNQVGVLPLNADGDRRGFIRTAWSMQTPASNMGATDPADSVFMNGKPEEFPHLAWRTGWSVPLWAERWYKENDEQNRVDWINLTPSSTVEDVRMFNSFYTSAPKPSAWVCPQFQPTPKHKTLVQGGSLRR